MRKTLLSLSILAALGLGGCDKPPMSPGVSTGSSSGSGADVTEKQSVGSDRRISDQESQSVAVQMPAWGLIVEMAREFWAENKSVLDAGSASGLAAVLTSSTLAIFDAGIEQMRSEMEQTTDPVALSGLQAKLDDLEQQRRQIQGEAARSECTDDLGPLQVSADQHSELIAQGGPCGAALALADAIVQAASGEAGWPHGIGFDVSRARNWSMPYARMVEFVSVASAELAKNIGSNALRDPVDAQQRLRAALVTMAKNGTVKAAWDQSQVDGNYQVNFSGNQKYPVEFNVSGTTYGRDQAGWHVVKYGIPWFGGGKLLGKDMTIAMQSAVSTDMSISQSRGQDVGSRAQSETRGEAGIR